MIVIYFHEIHALNEWKERLGSNSRDQEVIAVCQDYALARAAKANGFRDVFYSKKCDSESLTATMLEAIAYSKTINTDNPN